MANVTDIKAGRAYVEVGTDESEFNDGMRRISAKMKEVGNGVRDFGLKIFAAGAAVSVALQAATYQFANAGSEMAKMSARTGISVEALSGLKFAAEQTGAGAEALETGIKRMQVSILGLARGTKDVAENFTALGITINDLKGLSPDQQFRRISDALAKVKDPGIQAALAVKIFGRNAIELLPLLQNGSKGIDEYVIQAKKLGLIMSSQDALAAEGLMQSLKELWDVMKMGVFAIGSALAPAMRDNIIALTGAIVGVTKFIRAHKELILTVSKVAALVSGVGIAIAAFGIALSGIGTLVGVFAPLAVALSGILGPLVLIGVATLAIGAYFTSAQHTASAALQIMAGQAQAAATTIGNVFSGVWRYLKLVWTTLKTDALRTFQAIKDALSGGDWQTAAQIGWTFLKLEWVRGSIEIMKVWNEVLSFVETVWNNTVYAMSVAWHTFIEMLIEAWFKFVAAIETGWFDVVAFLRTSWNDLYANLRIGLIDFLAFFETAWAKSIGEVRALWAIFKGAIVDTTGISGQVNAAAANNQTAAKVAAIESKRVADVGALRSGQASVDNSINADAQAKIAQAQKDRDDRIASLRTELAATNKRLSDERNTANQKASVVGAENVTELEKRKRELQKELDDLVAKAAKEKAKAGPEFKLPKFDPRAAADAFNQVNKEKDRGAFNVTSQAAFRQIFGTDPDESLKRSSADTARNTAEIKELLKGQPRNQRGALAAALK